jgi:hypothetical protein
VQLSEEQKMNILTQSVKIMETITAYHISHDEVKKLISEKYDNLEKILPEDLNEKLAAHAHFGKKSIKMLVEYISFIHAVTGIVDVMNTFTVRLNASKNN